MSCSTWHKIRKALSPYMKEVDRQKRKEIKIPLHIRFLSFFSKGFKQRYLKAWEKEHRRKLKRAMKISSHIVRGRMMKLLSEIKLWLSVNGLERLKKRAIKGGYCKPEGNAIDYPKSGVKVV